VIGELRHEQYGQSPERCHLLNQLELQLEELEAETSENAAQAAAGAENELRRLWPRPRRWLVAKDAASQPAQDRSAVCSAMAAYDLFRLPENPSRTHAMMRRPKREADLSFQRVRGAIRHKPLSRPQHNP
jgi:hypothetical protein